jgi:hypothetical protein
MKVTRLKKGYRIRLSDTEMSVLRTLFGEGSCSGLVLDHLDGLDPYEWTPAQKAVINKLPNHGEQWLDTTEDRRDKWT